MHGCMHVGLDKVGLRDEETQEWLWTTERAKFELWKHRSGLTLEEMAGWGLIHHQQALAMEEAGFRMLAWPLVADIAAQGGFDVLVGPTALEAPPDVDWCDATDAFQWSQGKRPMVLIEAVPEEQQDD
eukprot:2269502-Rhodomonas_salina.1